MLGDSGLSLPSAALDASMKTARELLIDSLDERRPIILLLGQDGWSERGNDSVLVKALDHLNRGSDIERGWLGVLGTTPAPSSFYDWQAERFERRVHPPWLTVLRQLPWSAAFTSSVDPTVRSILQGPGREPEAVLTGREIPRSARSRARPDEGARRSEP
jgi:hypothetical protein